MFLWHPVTYTDWSCEWQSCADEVARGMTSLLFWLSAQSAVSNDLATRLRALVMCLSVNCQLSTRLNYVPLNYSRQIKASGFYISRRIFRRYSQVVVIITWRHCWRSVPWVCDDIGVIYEGYRYPHFLDWGYTYTYIHSSGRKGEEFATCHLLSTEAICGD